MPREQTFPEISAIAAQMWRSCPNFSWNALIKTLRWKARQPGGKEKLETAAGAMATYAASIGKRAYVEQGIDIRNRYPLIIWGAFKYDLLETELALGLRFVREKFEALQRGHSRVPERAIFIPEGQLLYSREVEAGRRGNLSYLTRFFTMANSMGIMIWIACQSVSRTSPYVLNNCATVFIFRQDGVADAQLCAEKLALDESAIPDLMSLPPGVAYVRTPGWDRALKLRMQKFVSDSQPDESRIRQRFNSIYDSLHREGVYAAPDQVVEIIDWRAIEQMNPAGPTSERSRATASSTDLLEDHYQLLCDIAAEPLAGLKKHYTNLRWGIERGNNILRELKATGAITIREEKSSRPSGGRARLVATLTPVGRQLLEAYERRSATS